MENTTRRVELPSPRLNVNHAATGSDFYFLKFELISDDDDNDDAICQRHTRHDDVIHYYGFVA